MSLNITLDARYVLIRNENNLSTFINDHGIVRVPLEEFDIDKIHVALDAIEDLMHLGFKINIPEVNKDYEPTVEGTIESTESK